MRKIPFKIGCGVVFLLYFWYGNSIFVACYPQKNFDQINDKQPVKKLDGVENSLYKRATSESSEGEPSRKERNFINFRS